MLDSGEVVGSCGKGDKSRVEKIYYIYVFMGRKCGKQLWEWDQLRNQSALMSGKLFSALYSPTQMSLLSDSLNDKLAFTSSLVTSAPQEHPEVEERET